MARIEVIISMSPDELRLEVPMLGLSWRAGDKTSNAAPTLAQIRSGLQMIH